MEVEELNQIAFYDKINSSLQQQAEAKYEQSETLRVMDKREDASLGDWLTGMSANMFSSNKALGAVNKLLIESNSNQRRDPEFEKANSVDYITGMLTASELPLNDFSFSLLSGATNKDQFDYYLDKLQSYKALDSDKEFLGTGGAITSTVAGLLSDPTYLVFVPSKAMQMLSTATKMSGVTKFGTSVAANSAMQYSMAKFRQYGDPSMDETHVAIDTAFGGAIGSWLSLRKAGKVLDNDPRLLEEVATSYADQNALVESARILKDKPLDFTTGYTWTATRPKTTTQMFDETAIALDETSTRMSALEAKIAQRETEVVRKAAQERSLAKSEAIVAKQVAKEVGVAEDVRKFQEAESIKLDSQIEKSGMSREEFISRKDNLLEDVKELKDIIRNAKPEEAPALREQLSEELSKMAKIDKGSAESIMYQIDKLSKKTSTPTKIVKTEEGLMIEKGRQNYNQKLKQFAKATTNKLKDVSKIAIKDLKPKLNKKLYNDLAKVRKQIDDISIKITRQIGNEERNLAKYDELTKQEAALSVKANSLGRQGSRVLTQQKELYERIASEIDKVMHEANVRFKSTLIDDIPPSEMDDLVKNLSDEIGTKLGMPIKLSYRDGEIILDKTIDFKVGRDGFAVVGKNKIAVATLLALGGSTAVMADSGDMVSVVSPAFYIIALAGGVYALNAFRMYAKAQGGYRQAFKEVFSIEHVGKVMNKPEFKSFEAFHKKISDKANIERINSFEMVHANGNDIIKELVGRIAYDPINPQEFQNAMMGKLRLETSWLADFNKAEQANFEGWLAEQNLKESRMDKIFHSGNDTQLREKFLTEVTDHTEFGTSKSSFVIAQSKQQTKITDEAFAYAVEEKLVGFTQEAKNPNYVTRIPLTKPMRDIIQNGGRHQLAEAIARTIAKDAPVTDEVRKVADEYIEWVTSIGGGYADTAKISAVIRAMDRMGLDTTGMDVDKIIAEARVGKDAISRGKHRLDMDMSKFGTFEVAGETIALSNVFERNALNLSRVYASEMAGAIYVKRATKGMSFAQNGIESESALRELVNKELMHHSDARETMTGFIDWMYGKPLYSSQSEMATRITNVLRDFSYARLYGTQFAMMSEHATSLSRMFSSKLYFNTQMQMFRNVLRNIVGKESVNTPTMEAIQHLTPFGSSALRRENTVKGIDNIFNMENYTGTTAIEKIGAIVKNSTLKVTNILHADDGNKILSAIYNIELLNKYLLGKVQLSPARIERYGINDKFREMFKDGFKADKNGNLLQDYQKGWTLDKIDEFNRVIDKMIMTDSPQAIISTLPHLSVSSNLGRLTAFITNFTATSYTTKFLAGATRPDAKSFFDTTVYFMGTYAGVYARHFALYGEEPDAEDTLYKALMMMPLTAPYALLEMGTDPMAFRIAPDTIKAFSKVSDAVLEE